MEPRRPIGRKPLADCSNTATLLKFENPNLTSSLKRLVDQTKLKDKPEDDNNPTDSSRSLSTTVRSVTRRISADLTFPTTRKVSEKEVAEPYSVYTVRRKAYGIKRNKETHQRNESKAKLSKKRQGRVKDEEDNSVHGASQEYIEQQRAYFAEVDAFKLSEEEVSNSDSD